MCRRDILHDDLTLETALFYTALLRTRADLSKEEVKARVAAAIADVRLQGKEHLRISSLSGGQRKRASIAMELLSDPKAIFLDEPTSGLSPDLDLEMMELLEDLAKKGRTIVVVTPAMDNLDKCGRVVFLGRGGRLCLGCWNGGCRALRWGADGRGMLHKEAQEERMTNDRLNGQRRRPHCGRRLSAIRVQNGPEGQLSIFLNSSDSAER